MIAIVLSAILASPDVFLISVDTLRADYLGCYGYERDGVTVLILHQDDVAIPAIGWTKA